MSAPQSAPSLSALELPPAPRRRVWIAIALLTLLWHLLLALPKFDWAPAVAPERVSVKMVDPKKLDAIRKQWKNRDKQLLLNQNSTLPKENVQASEDARYLSDRNRKVERETRAREMTTVPKPGTPNAVPAPAPQPTAAAKPLLHLSKLGIPWRFAPTPQEKRAQEQQRERQRTGTEGGAQYLREKNLPESAENMLNTQESVYYSFYARLYQSIAPLWQSHIREVPRRRRVQEGEYTTQVDVVMDRSGNLLEIRRLQGSGIAEFDQAVDTAWHKMANFPNPPAGLLDERGEVHTGWTFTVMVGQGFNLESLPPERNY